MGKSDLSRATDQAKLHVPSGRNWELILAEGAGPFISRIVHRLPDGSLHTWLSRPHRKCGGVRRRMAAMAWNPTELGWWISVLFMIGSSCFALASLAGIAPHLLGALFQQASVLNAVFFSGSIFFTSAAYLQLLEAANADRRKAQANGQTPAHPFCWLGWQPKQIGWLAAFIQFIGTLLFNLNTADALLPNLNWFQQDLLIWTPDVIGSICFLLASWLAVLECCHGIAFWKIQGIGWWVAMINLLGSLAFGLAAFYSLTLPHSSSILDLFANNLWTFIGAFCFLFAAGLLLPEMAQKKNERN